MTIIQIKSDRLFLRPIQMGDADQIFLYRSDAERNQYQGWIPKTVEDVRHFIASKISHKINLPGTWFQLAVVNRENNEFVGDIGIHFLPEDDLQIEIG